jgi:hypothetical protein
VIAFGRRNLSDGSNFWVDRLREAAYKLGGADFLFEPRKRSRNTCGKVQQARVSKKYPTLHSLHPIFDQTHETIMPSHPWLRRCHGSKMRGQVFE